MIQWRCSRSSMIQWRWARSRDDLDPDERWLKMKMNWRWRWWEVDDDSDDTEKKTCANKLCWENTFLVKRECWCNCNFGMYSSVFLMYCNPMFILGCIVMYLSHVIPRCLFREVYIMRKSCQVIMGDCCNLTDHVRLPLIHTKHK